MISGLLNHQTQLQFLYLNRHAGTVATITLQQFKECLLGSPKLRHVLRLLMVLQGLLQSTPAYEETLTELLEVISDWITLKKAGRSGNHSQSTDSAPRVL